MVVLALLIILIMSEFFSLRSFFYFLSDNNSYFFERTVEVPRIKVGKSQTIQTLAIKSLLFVKFLRNETQKWIPKLTFLDYNLKDNLELK